jgi:hypothetical protein
MDRITVIGGKGTFTGTAGEWDRICARNAGRKAYNHTRQLRAVERRAKVRKLWEACGGKYGSQKIIARQLKVSPAQICRDLKRIYKPDSGNGRPHAPG